MIINVSTLKNYSILIHFNLRRIKFLDHRVDHRSRPLLYGKSKRKLIHLNKFEVDFLILQYLLSLLKSL